MVNALAYTAQDLGGAFSAERFALAGQMTLIGMLMIFSVLAILWGVLTIFKFIFAKPAKPVKKVEEESKEQDIVEDLPDVVEENNDEQLVAVITAAVAAYIESEEPSAFENGFRVVSFRRANGGKSWNTK